MTDPMNARREQQNRILLKKIPVNHRNLFFEISLLGAIPSRSLDPRGGPVLERPIIQFATGKIDGIGARARRQILLSALAVTALHCGPGVFFLFYSTPERDSRKVRKLLKSCIVLSQRIRDFVVTRDTSGSLNR